MLAQQQEADMNVVEQRFDIVDKATFRNGMSRLGSAVNVVTTRYGGRSYGFTASAVCRVSDTPPTLLVSINRASSCFHTFENARHFCVNTLMPGQEDISNHFGGKTPMGDRFAIGDWREALQVSEFWPTLRRASNANSPTPSTKRRTVSFSDVSSTFVRTKKGQR